MKVSVCIPAYNRPEYLRVAIQSALNQSYQDYEILIVDDASPSNIEQVVREFSDQRIRFVRNSNNLNFVKNWNRCLKLSRGTYIKFLLDDDTFEPDIVEKQASVLDSHPEVGFVGCRYKVIDKDGQIRKDAGINPEQYRLYKHNTQESGKQFILNYLMGDRAIGLPTSIMFRKSIMRPSGFDPEAEFAADIEMWCDLALRSDFYYIDQDLCNVRLHTGTVSESITRNDVFNYRRLYVVLDKLFERMNDDYRTYVKPTKAKAYWRVSQMAIVNAFRLANREKRSIIFSDIQKTDPFIMNRARALALWITIVLGRQVKRFILKKSI